MRKILLAVYEVFRTVLQFLLKKPILWMANRFSSDPKQENVFRSLTELYRDIITNPGKKGLLIGFRPDEQPLIIFSDLHKGTRDGADDFAICEPNYLAALEYYHQNHFYYINLGDSEELWENILPNVMKYNKANFEQEKKFADRNAFVKIFGNHDLFWGNDPLAPTFLKSIYGRSLRAHAGVVLRAELPYGQLDFFCTHGHQGDGKSDGNAFSKWIVTYIWGPLQAFLEIHTDSPSANTDLKTLHNQLMYDWSSTQENLVLITGHTHQPVFKSLTHLERLYLQLEQAQKENNQEKASKILEEIPRRKREYNHINQQYPSLRPGYFNTGCCCYNDGTITGLEIAEGFIRLVKWSTLDGKSTRIVAEEETLVSLSNRLCM